MAAAAPGSRENAEYGFSTGNSSVLTVGATDSGFLQAGIDITLPREYAYLQLDADRVDLDAVCIKKDLMLAFACGEVLEENLQDAWDNDAPAGGVLTFDGDMGGNQAIIINLNPPNDTGNDTRRWSLPTARAIGEGPYSVPLNGLQTIAQQWKALGDANALLGTQTDTYYA